MFEDRLYYFSQVCVSFPVEIVYVPVPCHMALCASQGKEYSSPDHWHHACLYDFLQTFTYAISNQKLQEPSHGYDIVLFHFSRKQGLLLQPGSKIKTCKTKRITLDTKNIYKQGNKTLVLQLSKTWKLFLKQHNLMTVN